MKKIIFSSLLATAVLISSCLKDKNFEDQIYGTQESGIKGIGFKNTKVNLALGADATPQIISNVTVGVNAERQPTSNVGYTVVSTPTLVPAGVTVLPANAFSIVSPGSVKANEYFDTVKITITNASLLDPTKTYGIGLTLNSADPNYVTQGNGNTVVVTFNVKNKYDGLYRNTGYFYHPTASRALDLNASLATASANSFTIDLGDLGAADYKALVTVNADNSVTIVAAPGAAGAPYTMFDTALPTTNPGYTTVAPGYAGRSNYYDPATKTFYLRYGYMGGSGWRVTEEKIVKL